MRTVAFCEIEPYPRAVLKKHWPTIPCYDDIRTLTADRLKADGIGTIDVICGGFPCQDVSYAGKNASVDGERTGLWREYTRLIGELEPDFVVMENVTGLLDRGLGLILGELAKIGYDCEWHSIPASYVAAWHRRDRVWLVAYPNGKRGRERFAKGPILRQRHLQEQSARVSTGWTGRSNLPTPKLCRNGYGVSKRLDALGNAVVPQIPEIIGRAIMATQNE